MLWLVILLVAILAGGGGGYYYYYYVYNGNGTITLADGSTYTGAYKSKKPEGQGSLTRPDGAKYVGGFSQGQFNGEGTLTFPDGTKYTGQFNADKYNGEGTLETPGQGVISGAFKDGKTEGKATKIFADGTTLKGEFHNGVPHGPAVIIRPNEDFIYEQNYNNGEKSGNQIKKPPVAIRNIVLSNNAKDNTILQDNLTQFAKADIRYVSFRLEIVSVFPRIVQGDLEIIYRSPNGVVDRNTASSPPGVTMSNKVELASEGMVKTIKRGWGNETGGNYQKGRNKIEFWWKGIKVDEVGFDVI